MSTPGFSGVTKEENVEEREKDFSKNYENTISVLPHVPPDVVQSLRNEGIKRDKERKRQVQETKEQEGEEQYKETHLHHHYEKLE